MVFMILAIHFYFFYFFIVSVVYCRRDDFVQMKTPVLPDKIHSIVVGVKQLNLDKIEEILYEVSDPFSSQYGNHLSREKVGELTLNTDALRILKEYFASNDINILQETLYGEYITVEGPVSTFEKIFSTKFYNFQHKDDKSFSVIRALDYTIHDSILPHVSTVFNVVDIPFGKSSIKPIPLAGSVAAATGSITPSLLNTYYNIFSNVGSMQATQTIYSAISQYWSSTDLATFQSTYGVPSHPLDADPNNVNVHSQCVSSYDNCAESNLDVQYITAVAQNTYSSIIYDSTNDAFVTWITSVANSANPSKVYSISYGIQESDLVGYSSYTTAFNTEAMKLGVMGTTIFVASGDDGAPGYYARSSSSSCGYDPSFPATSPYVVAVGATMGPEAGTTEIVCDSKLGGVITSGGGFSKIFTALSHQQRAIKGYFKSVTTAAVSGYSTTGRGIPDISLAGKSYAVVIGGKTYSLCGTSASSPAVAGMFSLINSARIKLGLSTVGWVNPAIYAYNGSFANDITSGNIKCTASVCCTQGFYAAKGWDPTTGFGSVDFQKLYNLFVPSSAPSSAPSKSPSSFPTTKPTIAPTISSAPSAPTVSPTQQPSTFKPTISPTTTSVPTLPTAIPTAFPSSEPTISPSSPTAVPTSTPTTAPTPTRSPVNAVATASPTATLGATLWKYSTGGIIWTTPSIDSDGTIYIGSDDRKLYALSSSGAIKWSYLTGGELETNVAIAPAGGTVYAGSVDGGLYAVTTSGVLRWKYSSGGTILSSPTVGSDGTVYFGSYDKYIYAVLSTGVLKWRYLTGGVVVSSPVLGSNGYLYIGSNDGYLYAISSTGSLVWKYYIGIMYYNSPTVGSDGTVYIASYYGYIFAFTSAGVLKWRYLADYYVNSPITLATDGTLYFGCDDYYLYALTAATGAFKWAYGTSDSVESTVAIGADGTLYFGSYDSYVYALTSAGNLKWKYLAGGYIVSNPTIGKNGNLLFGNYDYNVYSIYIGYASAYTSKPSVRPTVVPSRGSTNLPSAVPTRVPSAVPTRKPSSAPTTKAPARVPSAVPTRVPSAVPTRKPSSAPTTKAPTRVPSAVPTRVPSAVPTRKPSSAPTTKAPTRVPSAVPTRVPSAVPTRKPSSAPSSRTPTRVPSRVPTKSRPTGRPSATPTRPTSRPSTSPTA